MEHHITLPAEAAQHDSCSHPALPGHLPHMRRLWLRQLRRLLLLPCSREAAAQVRGSAALTAYPVIPSVSHCAPHTGSTCRPHAACLLGWMTASCTASATTAQCIRCRGEGRRLPATGDCCLLPVYPWWTHRVQELRELVVRGIDGPGLHILDVLADSYANAEGTHHCTAKLIALPIPKLPCRERTNAGIEAQLAARRQEFERFGCKPSCFHARGPFVYCPPDMPPQMQQMSRDGSTKCRLATDLAASTARPQPCGEGLAQA